MGVERSYSETTVFPLRALSPENWVYKSKMAVAIGIPNIFLMNGIRFISGEYWSEFTNNLNELKYIEEQCAGKPRTYPIHVMCGTHGAYGESIEIPPLPFLAGLPVRPVRAKEADPSVDYLICMGDFILTEEWLSILPKYKYIIMDSEITKKNKVVLKNLKLPNITIIPGIPKKLVYPGQKALEIIHELQSIIKLNQQKFPFVCEGYSVGLIWMESIKKTILFNLENVQNNIKINYQCNIKSVSLKPLEFHVYDETFL
jgi:hypothetical protein